MEDPKQNEYWQARDRYGRIILVWGAVITLLGIFGRSAAFAVGGLSGGLVAWFNFRMLAADINKAMTMSPEKARTYAASRYVLRYAATGVVLATLLSQSNLGMPALLAAIFPLLSIKLTLYLQAGRDMVLDWLQKRQDSRNS